MQNVLTRRECLGAGAALAGATRVFAVGPKFSGPIGVQLYTVRDVLKTAPAETIAAIAALGYKEVEVTLNSDFSTLLPLLKKNKLAVVSCHFDPPLITDALASNWSATVDQAHASGIRYMVMPYLRPAQRGGSDSYKRLADQLNQAATLCQKSGMTLAYHNHAFEFQPLAGTRPFDILMQGTDPKLVKLEMDVFWVSTAGQDPVSMLKQYPGRVVLLHLKDKAAGAPVRFAEDVDHEAFKEVGAGSLDFAAILKAAKGAGVQHYFVEQDYCPGNPIDSLRKSYQFLKS